MPFIPFLLAFVPPGMKDEELKVHRVVLVDRLTVLEAKTLLATAMQLNSLKVVAPQRRNHPRRGPRVKVLDGPKHHRLLPRRPWRRPN